MTQRSPAELITRSMTFRSRLKIGRIRHVDEVKLNKFIKLVKIIMQINYSGVKIDQRIEPVSQYERSGISL